MGSLFSEQLNQEIPKKLTEYISSDWEFNTEVGEGFYKDFGGLCIYLYPFEGTWRVQIITNEGDMVADCQINVEGENA